jgi:hypothetical protein
MTPEMNTTFSLALFLGLAAFLIVSSQWSRITRLLRERATLPMKPTETPRIHLSLRMRLHQRV